LTYGNDLWVLQTEYSYSCDTWFFCYDYNVKYSIGTIPTKWNFIETSKGNRNQSPYNVEYGRGKFIRKTNGKFWISTTGIQWNLLSFTAHSIRFIGPPDTGFFYAFNNSYYTHCSNDGDNWNVLHRGLKTIKYVNEDKGHWAFGDDNAYFTNIGFFFQLVKNFPAYAEAQPDGMEVEAFSDQRHLIINTRTNDIWLGEKK